MAKILIVDDDKVSLMKLRLVLEQHGHQVFEATDGVYVDKTVADCDPDLLITDMIMPEKEGIDTIISVHQNRPGLPIITMSGNPVGISFLEMSKTLGASHALRKPIDNDELITAISQLLD